MGPEVPTLLARLKSLDPALTVEVLIDNSRALLDGFESGRFDAVIIRSDDGSMKCGATAAAISWPGTAVLNVASVGALFRSATARASARRTNNVTSLRSIIMS